MSGLNQEQRGEEGGVGERRILVRAARLPDFRGKKSEAIMSISNIS
jgi:hypothetical protein